MGVRMELSEVNEQTLSVEEMCKSYINSMESIKGAIDAFVDETGLRGKTYESAKDYFSSAYIPLANGIILLCEEMLKAHNQFLERYIEDVDSNSLDSDVLQERIEELKRMIEMMESVNIGIPGLNLAITGGLTTLNVMRLKMEEKLQNLLTFDSSSPEIFSNIDELLSSVQAGLKEVNDGKAWNSAAGKFETDKLNLDWVSEINHKMNENEKELIKGTFYEMTEDDLEEAARLAATDPKAILDFIRKNFVNISNSTSLSIIAGSYEQGSKSFREFGEHLKKLFKDNKSFLKKLNKYTDKVGGFFVEKGDKWLKVGKAIGRTNIAVGFGIGMYDDVVNEDKTVGEAIAHNGLVISAGGIIALGGATFLSATLPVTSLVAGTAIGVTLLIDYQYENNEAFQEFVDSEVGEAIQRKIEDPIIIGPNAPFLRFYDA